MKEKQEIDFVITWVDDTDSEWQKEKALFTGPPGKELSINGQLIKAARIFLDKFPSTVLTVSGSMGQNLQEVYSQPNGSPLSQSV